MKAGFLVLLIVCTTLAPMAWAKNETSPRVRVNANIMQARQFTECSGAFYASSEVVKASRGKAETATAFHENGNSYLLAAAWALNVAEPAGGFQSAYDRAEVRSSAIKANWLKHIGDTGDRGVGDINKVTQSCTDTLGTMQQSALQQMRRHAGPEQHK